MRVIRIILIRAKFKVLLILNGIDIAALMHNSVEYPSLKKHVEKDRLRLYKIRVKILDERRKALSKVK